jgi:hypothetical protein
MTAPSEWPSLLAPRISPMLLLQVLAGITLVALLVQRIARMRRMRMLLALARHWRMQYTPRDIFNLASRIAPLLPAPGAADVCVSDLIYGTEPDGHRYILCAEFTVGVVRAKKRRRCVMSVLEPRQRTDGTGWSSHRVAAEDLKLIEQYRSLHVSP